MAGPVQACKAFPIMTEASLLAGISCSKVATGFLAKPFLSQGSVQLASKTFPVPSLVASGLLEKPFPL
eukprot:jgi/Botrbrau1/4399/Bobra.105_2s0042.1